MISKKKIKRFQNTYLDSKAVKVAALGVDNFCRTSDFRYCAGEVSTEESPKYKTQEGTQPHSISLSCGFNMTLGGVVSKI